MTSLNLGLAKQGYLQYPKKKRYFPLISDYNPHETTGGLLTDQDNNLTGTSVDLKFKGAHKRDRNRRKGFYNSEVPHAGTWVKRANSGLGSPNIHT